MNTVDLRTIVEAAVRAPSVHNTQPWRFAGHADDQGSLDGIDVYADRERALAVIDPFGRELHISCGAAIEFAQVAVRALGRQCAVHLLPDASDQDHLARMDIGADQPATAGDLVLSKSLPVRYTERDRFEDRPVPAEAREGHPPDGHDGRYLGQGSRPAGRRGHDGRAPRSRR